MGHGDIPINAKVGSLPPAMQQVIEIARALAVGCSILVLDEPTSSLSRDDTAHLFEIIRHLKSRGTSVIYISHFLEEITEISDTFTVLRDGRSVGHGMTKDTTIEEIIRLMVGRSIDQLYPHSQRPGGEALLSVEGLAGLRKPRAVSFTLHRGEVLGIAGLIGAGRTELLRSLFGLDPIKSGKVKVGIYSGFATPAARWSQSMGMVSEDRSKEGLAVQLSIADNIMMNLRKDASRFGFISPRHQKNVTKHLIDLLGIRAAGSTQRVSSLSGGNQQKVALARLLHEDVDIVLLDEPTRGIDVASKSIIFALIDQLAVGDPARGVEPKAVLMVSSYLPELIGICDRIAVMSRGRLGTPRPATQVDQQMLMAEAIGKGTSS
jgi:ribose transport system ATP-binding protein